MELKKLKEKLSESIAQTNEVVDGKRRELFWTEGYRSGMIFALQLAEDKTNDEDEEEEE